jgi:membrane protein
MEGLSLTRARLRLGLGWLRRAPRWVLMGLRPKAVVRLVLRVARALRGAILQLMDHDGGNIAQSAAFSAISALFPALIVAAAVMASLPQFNSFKLEVGAFFDEVLPTNVYPLLNSYFEATKSTTDQHPIRTVVLAGIVTLVTGSGALQIVLQGLGRAAHAAPDCWSFWQMRARALLLVPLSIVPLSLASVLVIFGRFMTDWIYSNLALSVRPALVGVAFTARWAVSLCGVAALTALMYHLGVPRGKAVRTRWYRTVPGAVLATLIWFGSTLAFGWYVTSVANYSAVYGSLGAGIALLAWLFLVFFSVLYGAEFNEQLMPREKPPCAE